MNTALFSSLMTLSVLFTTPAIEIKDQPGTKKSKTFILVHGAWMAPYAWDKVSKELTRNGAHVIVIELPGHGSDTTNPSTLSLDTYRDKVAEAVNRTDGKVILVGHSLAGMIISAVAEAYPEKIERLIYVGAFIPVNGQTIFELASQDAQSLLGPSLIPSADKLTLDVKHENITDIFCADSSPETQALVLKNFRVEPAIPFTSKAKLSEANFGKVNKSYIHTLKDHVIGINLQNKMVSAAAITDVYSLESSHTPFLSMPDKLTALLIKIARS